MFHQPVLPEERMIAVDLRLPSAGIYTVQLKGEYGVSTQLVEKQSY